MRIEERLRDAIEGHVGEPRADETAWSDLQRRVESASTAEVARGTSHRLVAAIVAFAVFGGAVALLWSATSSNPTTPSVSADPLATIPVGWTRLPLPPGRTMERRRSGPGAASSGGVGTGVGQARRGWVRLRPRHADVAPSHLPQLRDLEPRPCGQAQKRSSWVEGTAIGSNQVGSLSSRRRLRGEGSPQRRSTLRERLWCGRGRN
jgi:hypothetical protein